MASVLLLQHEPKEGPGTLGEVLSARGFALTLVRPFLGEPIPAALGEHAGLVVLGGGMSVTDLDKDPYLRHEIALLRQALGTDRPVLGICLGSQLLAAALGARVVAMPLPEIGWREVTLAEAARFDPLWARAPASFPAFHWHGDTFALPQGAELLASSAGCRNQAFAYGQRVLGVQFHPEVDEEIVRAMAEGAPDTIARAVVDPMAAELPGYRATMRVMLDAWAAQLR